jgi:hypothetical protein
MKAKKEESRFAALTQEKNNQKETEDGSKRSPTGDASQNVGGLPIAPSFSLIWEFPFRTPSHQ